MSVLLLISISHTSSRTSTVSTASPRSPPSPAPSISNSDAPSSLSAPATSAHLSVIKCRSFFPPTIFIKFLFSCCYGRFFWWLRAIFRVYSQLTFIGYQHILRVGWGFWSIFVTLFWIISRKEGESNSCLKTHSIFDFRSCIFVFTMRSTPLLTFPSKFQKTPPPNPMSTIFCLPPLLSSCIPQVPPMYRSNCYSPLISSANSYSTFLFTPLRRKNRQDSFSGEDCWLACYDENFKRVVVFVKNLTGWFLGFDFIVFI